MAKRIIGAVAALAGTAAIAAGAPAAADSGGVPAAPGTQCPSGFNLVPIARVLEIADPGFVTAIQAEDRNNDAQLCLKLLPTATPLFEPTFLFYDNRVPTP